MKLALAVVFAFLCVLVQSRTIVWTSAAGSGRWNDAGNWDCLCLPTTSDDVVIDIAAIPGNVQIGGVVAPALCNSLTVGGTSRFTQTLTVVGALTVGTGISTLQSNGRIIVKASPDAPFVNKGTFNIHGNGFAYSSGTLAGPGSFVFASDAALNLTDSAQKTISTTVVINGKATCNTDRSTNMALVGGSFIVGTGGLFSTNKDLTLATDDKSSFSVKGNFNFAGNSLFLQGNNYMFSSWTLASGTTVVNNGISSDTLVLQGTLQLIGGPSDKKSFSKVTGAGTIKNQGGVSTFGNLGCNLFEASGGNATFTSAAISTLNLNGAFIGGSKASVTTAWLSTGFIFGGLQLSAATLHLQGVVGVSDNGSSLIVQVRGDALTTSQLTLTAGSSFSILPGATFNQAAGLTIVQGAPAPSSPSFFNNGVLTSSGPLFVAGVPINGGGSINVKSGSVWTLNNVAVQQTALDSQGSIKFSVGSFKVGTVTGSGSFSGNPNTFQVSTFSASVLEALGGDFAVGNATISSLQMNNGATFSLSNSGSVSNLSFWGGIISGTGSNVSLTVGKATLQGVSTQTVSALSMKVTSFSLQCTQTCQLITKNGARISN